MELTRRNALRGAAGAALLGSLPMTDALAAAPKRSRRKPWYELGLAADPVLDSVLLFYLGLTWSRQADIGECLATAHRVKPSDRWSWPHEWTKTADHLREQAIKLEREGHARSAGELLMRASTYYRAALHRWPEPEDRRVPVLTRRAVDAFTAATRLLGLAAEAVEMPFERTTLPGRLFLARGAGGADLGPAPLLIVHQGRDAWAEDCLFLAQAANARGYHCLLFDGPGQGRVLRLQRLPLRPDWEHVVTPVVDWALKRPEVDPTRLALMGISMGGALAPRAAAFEHRLKLMIANPGVLDWSQNVMGQLSFYLGKDVVALLPKRPAAFDRRVAARMRRDPFMRWAVDDLLWKHGADRPSTLIAELQRYSNRDSVGQIKARTLVMDATADPYSQGKLLLRALPGAKDYLLLGPESTGQTHCFAGALSVGSQRFLDWFDRHI